MIALVLALLGSDLDYLHQIAHEVVDSAIVKPGAEIAGVGKNATGYTIRVPGGTQNYYPAFWIRDAAMMLGSDLVPAGEIEGWIRVVVATQPDKELTFPHGLRVPAYSIPDHITLKGEACWYPGAYAEQGVGDYGILPPADDAFFFIQMVYEQYRLSKSTSFIVGKIKGEARLCDLCEKAFDSVATKDDLVWCDPTQTRVDWGFCDSIRKTGQCLMPSLLRWQAANRLAILFDAAHRPAQAKRYRSIAKKIQASIRKTFYHDGTLYSATGLGHQDDVWASAFAVWLGVLPRAESLAVARHLLALVKTGGIIEEGQVRELPRGEYWDKAGGRDSYQNGGYWATPTGWLAVALAKVDRQAASTLISEFAAHVRKYRSAGAPFEWINPQTGKQVNAAYGSSAGLVYVALRERDS